MNQGINLEPIPCTDSLLHNEPNSDIDCCINAITSVAAKRDTKPMHKQFNSSHVLETKGALMGITNH